MFLHRHWWLPSPCHHGRLPALLHLGQLVFLLYSLPPPRPLPTLPSRVIFSRCSCNHLSLPSFNDFLFFQDQNNTFSMASKVLPPSLASFCASPSLVLLVLSVTRLSGPQVCLDVPIRGVFIQTVLYAWNPWTAWLIHMHPLVLSSNITSKGRPLWYPHLQVSLGPPSIYTTVLTGFFLILSLLTLGKSLTAAQLVYYTSLVHVFCSPKHLFLTFLPFKPLRASSCLHPQLMTLLPISSDCFSFLIEHVHMFLSQCLLT